MSDTQDTTAVTDAAARARTASRVTMIGLAANIVLVVIKYAAGIFASSGAMIADATHSLSDTLTDFAVIAGFRFVARPPDDDHTYGHAKIETLVSAFCGLMLLAAAIGIIHPAALSLWEAYSNGTIPEAPGLAALGAALLSIAVKEILYRYTAIVGRRLESPALIANAWHHRSDALSSVGTAVGIAAAAFYGGSAALLDPVAALIVGVFVTKAAWVILAQSCQELIEASIGREGEEAIRHTIESCAGVEGYHAIRSRRIGPTIAVDAHVFVDPNITVTAGHDIATSVERAIKREFGPQTYVNIHIEPSRLHNGQKK